MIGPQNKPENKGNTMPPPQIDFDPAKVLLQIMQATLGKEFKPEEIKLTEEHIKAAFMQPFDDEEDEEEEEIEADSHGGKGRLLDIMEDDDDYALSERVDMRRNRLN